MYLFYFLAFIPMLIGGLLWLFVPKVNPYEWIGGTVISFITAILFHIFVLSGMTSDQEIWSGQLTHARHFSAWEEYYEYAVYRTVYYSVYVSDGKNGGHMETRSYQVFDHWEPSTRRHDQYWETYANLGTTYSINEPSYNNICKAFTDKQNPVAGIRETMDHNSHMIEGDPNDYDCKDISNFVWPISEVQAWVNKVKAAPSVFSFAKVPPTIPVFDYPLTTDSFHSKRVLGIAQQQVDLFCLDQLNAEVGWKKHCNIILVGFLGKDSSIGQMQQAKWIGGKKNDIVITYGYYNDKPDLKAHPDWVYVFGWTEKDIVKQNIQSLFMENSINNDLLPKIRQEIETNYVIKNWHKFDYLTIEPPPSSYIWFLVAMIFIQGGFWFACYSYNNSEDNS